MNKKLLMIQENTLNDLRKIRDTNSERHLKMTPIEIIADINRGAQKVLHELTEIKIVDGTK